jgi:hypothetical protein
MAAALRKNGAGHLLCVDASRRWIAETARLLPPELAPYVTLHYSEAAVDTVNGVLCHRYRDIPIDTIDLLYLDGPDTRDVVGWPGGKPMSADPIHLEARFRPGFRMYVDGREPNVAFLKQWLRRRYRVKRDRWFRQTCFDLLHDSA